MTNETTIRTSLSFHGVSRVEVTAPKRYGDGEGTFYACTINLYDESGHFTETIGLFTERNNPTPMRVEKFAS